LGIPQKSGILLQKKGYKNHTLCILSLSVDESALHRQRAQTQSRAAREPVNVNGRLALSPAEFAASFGKHPSWAYRLLYANKLKAITELGRILIPTSELERIQSLAGPYNPEPKYKAQSGEKGEQA
jgi:hypothetical protein